MASIIMVPEYVTAETLQQGLSLRQSASFRPLPEQTLPDGRIRLSGRVLDGFGFADYPQVDLDSSGIRVSRYRCQCPQYRTSRGFCPHCAALIAHRVYLPTGVTAPEAPIRTGGADDPQLNRYSFRFCNSRRDLYPNDPNPRIPLERFYTVFGKNARAQTLHHRNSGWGGSCSGMVVSSAMLSQPDSGIRPQDFNPSAANPGALALSDRNPALDMTLHSFIECTHLLQMTNAASQEENGSLADPNCLDRLVARVEAYEQGKNGPALMGVWADSHFRGGHAVMPYQLRRFRDKEDVLCIYDPNWPMTVRFAYLTKDDTGHYIHWRFPMFDDTEYSSRTYGKLSFNTYEVIKSIWDARGTAEVNSFAHVNRGVLSDAQGHPLARVTADGPEVLGENVTFHPMACGSGESGYLFSLPQMGCSFHAEEALDLDVSGIHYGFSLQADGSQARFCIRDEQQLLLLKLPESCCRYQLTLHLPEADALKTYLLLDETGTDGLQLFYKDGQLWANALSDYAILLLNGQEVPLREHIRLLSSQEEAEEEEEQERIPMTGGLFRQGPQLEDLSYRFCNSRRDLYPSKPIPGIPLQRYFQVFGKNVRAKEYFDCDRPWNGNCFGMSLSAATLYQKTSGIRPRDFARGARKASQLQLSDRNPTLDMDLLSFLETAQLLQWSTPVQQERRLCLAEQRTRLDQLVQRVLAWEQGIGKPAALDLFRSPRNDGGHTVLPYRLEKRPGREDLLYVYDPNRPLTACCIYLEKASHDHYSHWRYSMNSEEYSSKSGGRICIVPYDAYRQAWESRGTGDTANLLTAGAGVTVCSSNGTVLAKITDSGVESFRENIYRMPLTYGGDGDDFLLSVPVGGLTFRLEDPSQQELKVKLVGVDLSVSITTGAREASLCVNDAEKLVLARVPEPDCSYTLELLDSASGDFCQTRLTGITGKNGLHLMHREGRLYANDAHRLELFINEEQAQPAAHILPLSSQAPQQEEQRLPNTNEGGI